MGSVIGSMAGSCAATCMCAACTKCCPNQSHTTRIPYAIVTLFSILVGIIMKNLGQETLVKVFHYSIKLCNSDTCLGNEVIYRVSFCLFCFYLMHVLVVRCVPVFHIVMWPLKLLIYVGLTVATFFIHNDFFVGYAEVARVLSILFLVMQVFIFIDFAYTWNEKWTEGAEDAETTSRGKLIALVVISLGALVASYVCLGLLFHYFAGGDCHTNNFVISMTIIFSLLHTVLAISSWCEHGALLPSALVTLYSTYLTYSSLSSDPDRECNPFGYDKSGAQVWIGLVILCCSIVWAGMSASKNLSAFQMPDKDEESAHRAPILDRDDVENGSAANDDGYNASSNAHTVVNDKDVNAQVDSSRVPSSSDFTPEEVKLNFWFHCMMACAATYMAMLLTNWGEPSTDTAEIDLSETSMWVKIVSCWLTNVLYLWTLIAPKICGSRTFE